MAIDIRSQTISASGTMRIGGGNIFFLISATAAVNINISVGGQNDNFTGAITGLKITRVKRWDYLDIVGAAGTVVSFFIGYENVREDDVAFQQALATISGTVAVASLPSVAINTPADNTTAANTAVQVAANLSRRRITIGCRASSPTPVRVSAAGLTATGIELQAGVFAEFDTTASLWVRNDTAVAGALWYVFEET